MTIRRFVVLGFMALATALAIHIATHPSLTRFSSPWRYSSKAAKVPAIARSLRPNYPYSIVPGGVYSPEELTGVNRRDSLVREHFADFDLRSVQLVKTTEDQYQYVSYRMGNHIFWTHRKLRIPKGEILLTDGKNFCRTRCGNRLSSKPHKEMTAMEPAERVLNLPPFQPEMLARKEVELSPPPPLDFDENAGPELPYDAPRLAPIFPAGTEEALLAKPAWPAANTNPLPPEMISGVPAAYIPPTQSSSGGPPLPIENGGVGSGGAAVPVIEDAPEPATVQLGFAALVVMAGLLLRTRRNKID